MKTQKNTRPVNKEVLSSRMGMEDPEAAAEEYREKVTQCKNSADNRVLAFCPRVESGLQAGSDARKGCGSLREGR